MSKEKATETILVLCIALVIAFLITGLKLLLPIAVALGAVGVFSKTLSYWIHVGWTKLSHILGAVSGRILLSLIFFLFLFPLSLLQKAFGKPSVIKAPGLSSYYKERNKTYSAEDIENMW